MATIPADTRLSSSTVLPARLRAVVKALRDAPLAAVVILGGLILAALLADVIAPYDPTLPVKGAEMFAPPFWMEGGSLATPLGTDRTPNRDRKRVRPSSRSLWLAPTPR